MGRFRIFFLKRSPLRIYASTAHTDFRRSRATTIRFWSFLTVNIFIQAYHLTDLFRFITLLCNSYFLLVSTIVVQLFPNFFLDFGFGLS